MDSIVVAVLVLALAVVVSLLTISFLRAKRAMKRFQILTRIAEVSDAGGSLEETFDAICEILVPELADFCMIDVVGAEGIERVAVRVGPGGGDGFQRQLARRRPSIPPRMTTDAGAPSPPRFFERMSEADLRELSHGADDLDFLRGLEIRSAITVALRARGKPTGALTLGVAWSGRSFRREHLEFAKVLSGRVALSLDNAGLFSDLERAERARTEIAKTLQHGLLPPPLPRTPGWAVAAMYRPAGAENEVGGDFYDAFPIAGGWMLAIGDVTGHGAQAASVAAQARYTLRTAASLTGNPLVALSTLNRALLARADAALCSVAAIALDKDPGKPVRLAVAGHPPPLLIDGDSVTETTQAGPVLGATPDATWEIEQVQLRPGRQLVVVTDGITEAGGPGERFGERRLRAELAGAAGPAAAVQKLEGALGAFAGGAFDDDAAILAITPTSLELEGVVSPPPKVVPLPSRPDVMIDRLFDAFNRRDAEAIAALCEDGLEFFAVTAEKAGRDAPYAGLDGLQEYLADVGKVWEELLVTATEIERRENRLLVRGRVYLRSREFGIRDMPAAWVWDVRDGRFTRGEVFADPDDAALRFVESSSRDAPGAFPATGKFQAAERG